MKKNNTIVLMCCMFILPVAAERDPFMCMVDQLASKPTNKTVLPPAATKQTEGESATWTVQQTKKNAVVLQDAQGNIREVSFSEEDKKPSNLQKAEGLGGNNT